MLLIEISGKAKIVPTVSQSDEPENQHTGNIITNARKIK
jgi:hypothetical protein